MKDGVALAAGAAALTPVKSLPQTKWFRVVSTSHLPAALSTVHTLKAPSRFYDPYSAAPRFRTLYFSDDPIVAQFEAQVLLGSLPRVRVPNPTRGAWVVLTVTVSLLGVGTIGVIDLSDVKTQGSLSPSVQELTGDWEGYRLRSPSTNVSAPRNSAAPTQELGEAIYEESGKFEGFCAVSAKVSTNRNLIVFPDHLQPGSFVEYEWDEAGAPRRYRVDEQHPDGRLLP